MWMTRLLLAAGTVIVISAAVAGDPPAPPAPSPPPSCLPVGKWNVEFTNGVAETCEIRKDESISVVEPRRSSGGRASIRDNSVVIVCDDDRVERWTPVGQRMVVEHWYAAARFPGGPPVLGVAERMK